MTDTSREAVERASTALRMSGHHDKAAMLDALLAERDADEDVIRVWRERAVEAEAKRDALAARLRLAEAVCKASAALDCMPATVAEWVAATGAYNAALAAYRAAGETPLPPADRAIMADALRRSVQIIDEGETQG